jgi:asparagine synthetase B (glutamine-hydrolysing)
VSPNLFFWIPLLRRAADDGVEILLDGEGGDELFGYVAQLFADRVRSGRLLSTLGLARRIPGSRGRVHRKVLAFYLRSYGLKGSVPYRLHEAARRRKDPAYYAPDWLRPEAAAGYAETYDDHAWKLIRGPRWFAHQLYRVTRGMGPALAYDHIRRRALLAGIEPRHPLIDVDVIELILRLPPELAYDHRYCATR